MAVITGYNNVNDRLEGGSDMDQISGLSGNDTLIGGEGRDTLLGGEGDDLIWTGSGSSLVRSADDVVDGGIGYDIVDLNYSDLVWVSTERPIKLHFVFGQSFQIQIEGYVGATISNCEEMQIQMADGHDYAMLGDGDDYVDANLGNDTVDGGDGDDWIVDGGGKFTLNGGAGSDTLQLDWWDQTADFRLNLADGVALGNGREIGRATDFEALRVNSGSGDDRFTSGAGADYISAGAGANTVTALAGDDTIYSWEGNDRIDGGDGADKISTAAGADYIQAGEGNDRIAAGDGKDTVRGGGGDDYIEGSDSFLAEDDALYGEGGNDVIRLAKNDAFRASAATMDGGAGRDTLFWTGGFKAGGLLDLADGSSAMPGGGVISGFEILNIWGGEAADTIIAGRYNDYLNSAGGEDRLEGGAGADTLVGETGGDTLVGGLGDDKLHGYLDFYSSFGGETGDNLLQGGEGNDTIFAMLGDDIEGGAGQDLLSFAYELNNPVTIDMRKAVRPNAQTKITGVEIVEGGNGADKLIAANRGIDLRGGYGADTLVGGAGNDTLFGSVGADDITLGEGEDTLVFYSLWQEGDTVRDFDPEDDVIRLDVFYNVLPEGELHASRLTIGDFAATPTATIAGPQFFYDENDGRLWLDWDGTGSSYQARLQATFLGAPEITAADFFVTGA